MHGLWEVYFGMINECLRFKVILENFKNMARSTCLIVLNKQGYIKIKRKAVVNVRNIRKEYTT